MIKPNHNDQTIHTPPDKCWLIHNEYEGVYVTIGNPAFCLFLYLTGIHFRGTLSTVVMSGSTKSSADQSELKKQVVSHCQMYYMDVTFCACV